MKLISTFIKLTVAPFPESVNEQLVTITRGLVSR